ncbi:methyltransferase [Micromonospora antibiotica]|uniref:Methyltransferase domain-containing protein n=1 Tax=Micromonospora antibiotica TaxID=2807623 RepID=A0ABS3V489_9ACTN|nr:methyltransferase [Micromonospora antibiotica]MBO4160433.1 methyltransferase domain-containing protein [Micromonospora antibiotica]
MITPTPLMHLVAGVWGFKTLAVGVEFGLFTKLAGGRTVTVAEAAAEFGLDERPADLLLSASASLGLLERAGDGYRNSALAEQFLVEGRPYYFGAQVRYSDLRTYLPWHRVGEALRGNRPLTWDPQQQDSLFDTTDQELVAQFWDAMFATSRFTARALADAYDFGAHRRLLDVGGGAGAFPIEFCLRLPHLRATILDLPHVCVRAGERIAEAGLTDRISAVPGDFLADPALPDGHDVILLSMILHDWDEPTNRALLARCFAALPPGGVVVISELLLNDERTGPPEAALMGMNMLVETEGGKNYSGAEYRAWLTDAGFVDVRTVPFEAPGANGAVLARRP